MRYFKSVILVLSVVVLSAGVIFLLKEVLQNRSFAGPTGEIKKGSDTTDEYSEQKDEYKADITPAEPTDAAETTAEPETAVPEPVVTQPVITQPETAAPPPPAEGDAACFNNALFIGDSRTIGLHEYADLGSATVFATKGLNVFRSFSERINLTGIGIKTLDELLSEKQFTRIYLMLGLNEIGYQPDVVIRKYAQLVEKIRNAQPDATLYLQANLHITEKRSSGDPVYNNINLNELNRQMSLLADGVKIIFVDVNPLFDDANGNLRNDITVDDFHLIGKHYGEWGRWLATK